MLRERLEQLGLACLRSHEHRAKVAELAFEYPHSIVPVENAYDPERYSCLMHALRFTGKKPYLAIASAPPRTIFAGQAFAHWLIESDALTEVPAQAAQVGDMVFYLDGSGNFQHVGLLRRNGRVESKWGAVPLYEHALFEVPAFYGSTVRYFKALAYEKAIEAFRDFARERGFGVDPRAVYRPPWSHR